MRALGLVGALLAFGLGLAVGRSSIGQQIHTAGERAVGAALVAAAGDRSGDARTRVLLEHPSLVPAILGAGAFGNPSDPDIATRLFSRDATAIEKARELTHVEEVAPRTWRVQLPVSNATVFETDDGLIVVDTGASPAGPALVDAIRSVSDAPITWVVLTHGHVDHAYGTWAILEAGATPQIIAHEALPGRFERYIRLRGSVAQYMSQPVDDLPRSAADVVWPTQTFSERFDLEAGGETFHLVHHRGETDDQLYVWAPDREVLASAEFHQEWIPNAGNGKRVQRHVEDWAAALREMASLGATVVVPGHGPPLRGREAIQSDFLTLAAALDTIVGQTIAGLNAGLRKDQVTEAVRLPPPLKDHPKLQEAYVSVQDVSKMVVKQYTGWWDDIPSHWNPAPVEQQAQALVAAAGGIDRFVEHGRVVLDEDPRLASHLADWAFFAEPDSPAALEFVLDTYKRRILDPQSLTQEKLVYLDQMAAARARQLKGER